MNAKRFLLAALTGGLLAAQTDYLIAQPAQAAAQPATAQHRLNVAPAESDWRAAFAQGSIAFKAGDYQRALGHFNQAHALASSQGKISPTLTYNRAVTYYKLGRYGDAKSNFALLIPTTGNSGLTVEDRQWADLGRYNLGLIARDQHQSSAAKDWFSQLQTPDTNARLRELAARQLDNMEKTNPVRPKAALTDSRKSSALLSLTAAHDDNASSLADELSTALSQAEDSYLNALAYGQHYVSGQRGQGLKVYGLAQMRRYQEFNSFDSHVLGGGAAREFTLNDWSYEVNGRLMQTTLNSTRLSTQYTGIGRAQSKQDRHQGSWELSYQGSFVDASNTYFYIEGWQHQLRVARVQSAGKVTITPSLSWETNSRENRRTEEKFYSYSPDIFSAGLAVRWDLNRDWRLYSQMDWSEGDYSDTNRLTDLGNKERTQPRHYERTQWLLGARYRISNHWSVKAEYNSIVSDDNFALYSYGKNVFSLKLDYGW